MKLQGWVILGSLAMACGCATPQSSKMAGPATLPATRPSDPKAMVALDQIEPRPVLAKPIPATQPAPLEAIKLFARARDALMQNQRYSAINLLEQALRLDPDSFQLNYSIGRAYAGAGGMNDRAMSAFERAAQINPDNLEIQTELGRAYQSRNDTALAVEHFRLGQQTQDYKNGDALAAVVDYRLGYLLQQQGYISAALECYTRLQSRLEHPDGGLRGSPEVVYLLSRPELVYEEIGRMHEELGDLPQAMQAYQRVAAELPDEFEPRARVVRLLVRMGRGREALDGAAELVRSTRASLESIALLREIHEKTGGRNDFVDELRRLHRDHPDDRALLFALADTLAGAGQLDEAADLLNRDINSRGGDVEVVQRLYNLYSDRDRVDDAARLVFRAMVAHPDSTLELQPLLNDLTRLSRKNALRLMPLTKMSVPAASEPARQYFVAIVASQWDRPSISRHALEQSAKATPVFDPAIRLLMSDYLTRPDWDDDTRQKSAAALIESVRSRNRPDLAEELVGQIAANQEKLDEAIGHYVEAERLSPKSGAAPELVVAHALALRGKGDIPRFEQMMWKLISDRPHCSEAYRLLLQHYQQGNAESQAWNVRNTWIANDPQNIEARLKLIDGLIQLRRADEAVLQMRRLFDEKPDDSAVVDNLISLLGSVDQWQTLIDLLEAERFRHPNNRVVTQDLVILYASRNRPADAIKVLEAARAAVANDPDLLYYVANLYHQIDRPDMTEQVLQDVLKVDPNHPQAANDLGYTWADEGKNLEQAESLIRIAVNAEPDNPSYLDSLGWALYKRSKFEEAAKLLQQATEPRDSADPIVLDHLGDTLYQLGRTQEAQATWQEAAQRLGVELSRRPGRSDLQQLGTSLQSKLRQLTAGQPIIVAPVVESPPNSQQTSKTGQSNGRP